MAAPSQTPEYPLGLVPEGSADVVHVTRLTRNVAAVVLNRPDQRNAVDGALARALANAVAETEADPDVWAVVLTGAGGGFSAGADLKTVSRGGMAELYTEPGGFAGFVDAPRTKVWIAAVEGFALAGGFEMVLACDLVVASQASVFGLPEVTRGLVAAAGGAYRLPRALPRALALELLATGARLDARRAEALGLVNRVAAPGCALPIALELAEHICANAPLAVRESLAIAKRSPDLDEPTLRRLSHEAQDRLSRTEDFAEGPRAFIEKRAPCWTGR